MQFKNFRSWRGRLPHWRADDVTYYVTFRHRRALEAFERTILFQSMLRMEGKKIEISVLCVLSEATEMLFTVPTNHQRGDFAKSIEGAKRKAGKKIIEKSNERFLPFYEESYDRIVRDEDEFAERFEAIIQSPVDSELVEEPGDYPELFVPMLDS